MSVSALDLAQPQDKAGVDMAESYGKLEKQISKIVKRLDHLESYYPSPKGGSEPPNGVLHQCALPQVREREFAADVSSNRERLIRYIDKKWVNGTKLHYYFFPNGPWSGPETEMEFVREGFGIWEDIGIGLEFEEVNDINDAEIRIGFLQGDGAWSYVGRDVIDIPGQNERTMNFGWRMANDTRGVDVAVHEIGHTLGFPHEHQNPFAGIVWDEDAVYDHFGGPPNNWPRSTTFHNILRKLPLATVEGSDWDANSIMHYSIAPGLILQPVEHRNGIRPAGGLSEADIAEVKRFYPPLPKRSYSSLEPFQPRMLSLEPAGQANFRIEPGTTREFTMRTFGSSDTLMVLFEERDGELRYLSGDDDSGTNFNASIQQWLHAGKTYVLRVRLYLEWASGDTAVMMW